MTTATRPASALAPRLGLAAIAAAAVNAAIAQIAGAFDEGGIGMGLSPAAYLPATVVGMLVGTLGWLLLSRYAPKALPVAVPVALALSLVPDALLLTSGASAANVIGLMLMHATVASAVVAAFRAGRP
ncbi:DUF6069 family protein [Saccharopolyspora sp. MS10]|uniref:DUF6069 family protein n=1 Tax=Saccharopolyspora sp. MS10 TaxID=3385973 RepID=UPI00399F6DE8